MKHLKLICLALSFSFFFISCREEDKTDDAEMELEEKTITVEGVEVDEDAAIEVSDDGQKIKMEDSEKEVKIKKDEYGNVVKKKVDYKND